MHQIIINKKQFLSMTISGGLSQSFILFRRIVRPVSLKISAKGIYFFGVTCDFMRPLPTDFL